jgi:hypothetical protein
VLLGHPAPMKSLESHEYDITITCTARSTMLMSPSLNVQLVNTRGAGRWPFDFITGAVSAAILERIAYLRTAEQMHGRPTRFTW